ncbi:hypothetical protein MVEN_01593300 [Mycena venus]|uniref:Uncharacterized protein n=1 Tax=Mycena venus TaxID=2733690 RepID=A0A8H7CRQ4_9AGAR|nr:hypothetical protein MVEN_01593300 [Mycena venus]
MTPNTAILAGMAVANIFYGIHFNLYVISTYLFARHFKGDKANPLYRSMLFVSSGILFILITANTILLTVRVFQGFILSTGGPALFFRDQTQATSVVLNTVTMSSLVVNDLMMIHRLYTVWCRTKLIMILPLVAWIGFTVCAVLTVVDRRSTSNLALVVSITPNFVFTLAVNVYCTVFIAWKIYTNTKACMLVDGTDLRDLLAMLVESSALYTSWALFYTVTHQVNDNSQYLAVATLPPIAGIANALFQTRIVTRRSIEPSEVSQPIQFRAAA